MANSTRKLIDLTGAPFVVEKGDDGKYYIIGIKLRNREFLFANGIPEDIIEKISGVSGNDKIDGIEEIEEFLEGMPEDSKLQDELQADENTEDLEQEVKDIFFPDGMPE